MPAYLRKPALRRLSRARVRLNLEPLEERSLLAATSWPGLLNPQADTEHNDTVDTAQDLGSLDGSGQAEAVGTIGPASSVAADVDWYRFTLAGPSRVSLTTLNRLGGSSLVSVLSLYNENPHDYGDLYNPTGHRLVAQSDGSAHEGDAFLERVLAPGTYYVAVSGSGNGSFHPFIADSGYAGSTGDYGLLIQAVDLGLDPAADPTVLASDPADSSVLDRSPFVLRLALSGPIDPFIVQPGVNVTLTFNPNGTFGDGSDLDVPLAWHNYSATANELQLVLASALMPGHYRLVVMADSYAGHLLGADFTSTFQVAGVEGNPSPGALGDDSPATAQDLGDLTNAGFVQRAGAIGDDPAYSFFNLDPFLFNPASDVDLYHFRLTGPGRHAFVAEVFAGRIGSPLDPGISLYRVRASDQQLQLVAVNDNTDNASPVPPGIPSLTYDAAFFVGLTAGDYYLAVSGTGNLPDPVLGIQPGTNGVFDPAVAHSGQLGFTTGDYLLNLAVQPDAQPPHVVAALPLEWTTLSQPPGRLVVQFSEEVNVQQLAYGAFLQTQQSQVNAFYVRGADGVDYFPRLEAYDRAAHVATFVLLDALPNGVNEFRLSGPLGLTDLAGNPLIGNDPTGDYVMRITVHAPIRGTSGDPLQWSGQEPNDDPLQPQDLGILFPREIEAGVRLVRDFTASSGAAPSDTADHYRFELLQARDYFFTLNGTGLPEGTQPTLTDASGNPVLTVPQAGGSVQLVTLAPGRYVLHIGGWAPGQAGNVAYEIGISLGSTGENPTPLTVGPAPALRIRLTSQVPPVPQPDPPVQPPPPLPPVVPPPSPPAVPPLTPPVVAPRDPALAPPQLIIPVPPSAPAPGAPVSANPAGPTSPFASLLPGAFLAFSAAPLGGVRELTPGEELSVPTFLVLRDSNQGVLDGLLRLTILAQTPFSGGESRPPLPTEWSYGAEEPPPVLQQLWMRALEALLEMGDWLEIMAVPLLDGRGPGASGPPEDLGLDLCGSGADQRTGSPQDAPGTPSEDCAWLNALVALGATVAACPKQRRTSPTTPGLPRGRSSGEEHGSRRAC
jgi:hypothetical protein